MNNHRLEFPCGLAVDYSWLGQTGIGRVASEVLSRTPSGIAIKEIRQHKKNVSVGVPLILGHELRKVNPTAFWSPGFMPPLQVGKHIPTAITIHDLTHRHYYSSLHRAYYDLLIRPLVQSVDIVFTVSEYSRQEIIDWSNLPSDRVVRIYNGVDSEYSADGDVFKPGYKYVLYIGNRRSYKNLDRLLSAYALSGLAGQGIFLALSGKEDNELCALAKSLGINKFIVYLGFIPELDLPKVYRGALAVAFVSLYEGFGLPIIEGMGCGVPVLTSNCSSMPEIAGEAAYLVDPYQVEEIADGLSRVCLDAAMRNTMIVKGIARAEEFRWEHTASAYWANLALLS